MTSLSAGPPPERAKAAVGPSPDDLLTLLTVARSGRFSRAAEALNVNHTTVSRRLASLERQLGGAVLTRTPGGWELTDLGREAFAAAEHIEAVLNDLALPLPDRGGLRGLVRLSSSDGFGAHLVAPAVADVQRRHPRLNVEIITATRRVLQHRSGLDLEIVVGRPQVHRAETRHLTDYALGLYATAEYLARAGTPEDLGGLARHPVIFYVDSMLHVDDLDSSRKALPAGPSPLTSTNVFVHVAATRAGAGLGLLPCFMADVHPDLVRVLPGEFAPSLSFWLVGRQESLGRPAVQEIVRALEARVAAEQDALLGRTAQHHTTEDHDG